MSPTSKKILLIRFSSIGDVTQCLSVPTRLSQLSSNIHWVTRQDLAPLITGHPHVQKVWSLDRKQGFAGLLSLARKLRAEKFSHIYDAHNNLRSRFLCWLLSFPFDLSRMGRSPIVLRRSMRRWKRFLLFRFHINQFRQPFSGQRDLLEPLKAWGLGEELPPTPQFFLSPSEREFAVKKLRDDHTWIALVPSAAYPLKRWPAEYWKKLIQLLPQQKFILLGGEGDHFLSEICKIDPHRVHNFAGRMSLRETAAVIDQCQLVVSNDTGPMHFAEQLGKPTIALMGPAPFGFPSRPSTLILERKLECRPCSKHGQGPCVNKNYHECLRSISPEEVADKVQTALTQGAWT